LGFDLWSKISEENLIRRDLNSTTLLSAAAAALPADTTNAGEGNEGEVWLKAY
jgi:hypothetical protein